MFPKFVRLIFYVLASLFLSILLLHSNLYQSTQDSTDIQVIKSSIHSQRKLNKQNGQHRATNKMPIPAVKSVSRFLFFVGYARSGHSIIANLLNAHPHIVVSHDYSVFSRWAEEPRLHENKTWFINALLSNSWKYHVGSKMDGSEKTFSIESSISWQSLYKSRIQVIGDKAGATTVRLFRKNQSAFVKTYKEMKKHLKIPINVVHVIRNPYDNIAAMILRNRNYNNKNLNSTNIYYNNTDLKVYILNYFKQVQTVIKMIKTIPLRTMNVYIEELLSNPKQVMHKLCSFLHVECSNTYLHQCANSVYSSVTFPRDLVHWSLSNIELVNQNVRKINFLNRYSLTKVV